MYCYAAQIARWKHPQEEWGTYLDVKVNAPELLNSELGHLEKKFGSKDFGSIFFSSVTDPYNGMEAKYNLTRKCLEVLADFGYLGNVSILTKSSLVLKDIDVFKRLKHVSVGLTVTTLDDKVSRFLEIKGPLVSARIEALEKLHNEGIETYAFVGPLLPHVTGDRSKIDSLLDALRTAGVKEVWFELINLSPKIKSRLYTYLKHESPNNVADFEMADTLEYRGKLDEFIINAVSSRGMKLGLGKVIHHKKLSKAV